MQQRGSIHFGKVESSPRLARMLMLLSDGFEYTTRQISHKADIMAVNTAAAELRAQGIGVDCRCIAKGVYAYRLAEFAA